jgi:hypothetical protein
MNVIISVGFISERFPLLVDYEIDGDVIINSVRLIRQVVNASRLYTRPDGMCKLGPVYEAVWLFGQPGVNHLLSPAQLVKITNKVKAAIRNVPVSIPEDQILYLEQSWKT